MEDPGGGDSTSFGGWTFPYSSDQAAAYKYGELSASDTLLLGRKTYEGFAAAWPTMQNTGDFGEKMNGIQKYVVSTTLSTLSWQHSTLLAKDLIESIRKLKEDEGKDILLLGSAELANLVIEHKLVDEYTLMIYPVIIGQGKKLFQNVKTQSSLTLLEVLRFEKGIILARFQPAA